LLLSVAQSPLYPFLRRFPVDGEVANFLPTCYGLVTDLLRGSYGETGVVDFVKTCYGEVSNLLRTCCGEIGVMDFGLVSASSFKNRL